MLALGLVNFNIFLILLLLVFSFALSFSSFAVFYETYIFNKYKGGKFLIQVILLSLAEMIIFHPMNVFFALKGNFEYFIKRDKKSWGSMTRKGFDSNKK
jgi:poly-beta-1,6-N-acetyl-D-glucosamine synthase